MTDFEASIGSLRGEGVPDEVEQKIAVWAASRHGEAGAGNYTTAECMQILAGMALHHVGELIALENARLAALNAPSQRVA